VEGIEIDVLTRSTGRARMVGGGALVRCRSLALPLALLAGAISGPASAEDPVAMEKEMASLREQVAAALAKVPRLPGPFDFVTFSISGSVVTLEGFATQASLKADAQRVVDRIDWVSRVENDIEFHPSEPQADQVRRETLAVLANKLPDAFPERYPDLRIKVDEGLNVTIVGLLSPVNRTRLESALVEIRQLALVKSVESQVLFKEER
jgi:hypothetical protein